MKKYFKFIACLFVLLFLAACTKKETIIQEYHPPQPLLFGTWKSIIANSTGSVYYVFNDDGKNFGYILSNDEFGFRFRNGMAFTATDKQIQFYNTLYNYTITGDTMIMTDYLNSGYKYVRVKNPNFTPDNFCNFISIIQPYSAHPFLSNAGRHFGIDGDFLYMDGYNQNTGHQMYKYNTLNGVLVDSFSVASSACAYYKSGTLYYGYASVSKIYKGSIAPTTAVSTNDISYAHALSMNPSTGTIFASTDYGSLMAGSDNSNFSELFNFGNMGCNYIIYYKNDEFLCMKNGRLHKIKISPSFSVLTSYESPVEFSLSFVSTNGVDIWGYGYNYQTQKYQFLKLNL